jgi:two-component system chemotaxis response regulator CheB
MLADEQQSPVERSRHRPSGPPSALTCPECHGPLWEFSRTEPVRYRCRVGHVYYEEHLVTEKSAEIEAALWAALEALEERAELLEKVAHRMDATGHVERARSYREGVAAAQQRAEVLRGALMANEDQPEAAIG